MVESFVGVISNLLESIVNEVVVDGLLLTQIEVTTTNELIIYGKDIIDKFNTKLQKRVKWTSEEMLEVESIISNIKGVIKDYINTYPKVYITTLPSGETMLKYLLVTGDSFSYKVELVKLYNIKGATFNQLINEARTQEEINDLKLTSTYQFRLDYNSYKVLMMLLNNITVAKFSGLEMVDLSTNKSYTIDSNQKAVIDTAIANGRLASQVIDFKDMSGLDYTITPINPNVQIIELRTPRELNIDLNNNGTYLFYNAIGLHTPLQSLLSQVKTCMPLLFIKETSFTNNNPNIIKGSVDCPESITSSQEQLAYRQSVVLNNANLYPACVLYYTVHDKSMDIDFISKLSRITKVILVTTHSSYQSFLSDFNTDGLNLQLLIDTKTMSMLSCNPFTQTHSHFIDIIQNQPSLDFNALYNGIEYDGHLVLKENYLRAFSQDNLPVVTNHNPYSYGSILRFINDSLTLDEVNKLNTHHRYTKVINKFYVEYLYIDNNYSLILHKFNPEHSLIYDINKNTYIHLSRKIDECYALSNIQSILNHNNKTYAIINNIDDLTHLPSNTFDYIISFVNIDYSQYSSNIINISYKPILHNLSDNICQYKDLEIIKVNGKGQPKTIQLKANEVDLCNSTVEFISYLNRKENELC